MGTGKPMSTTRNTPKPFGCLPLIGMLMMCHATAQAAEDFRVRYNLAGSVGNGLFTNPAKSGQFGALAYTEVRIDKVTGNDGEPLKSTIPGGSAAVAPGVNARYGAQEATVRGFGYQKQGSATFGYVSEPAYQGGRWVVSGTAIYGKRQSNVNLDAPSPQLEAPYNSIPAVQNGFSDGYQAGLAQSASRLSGEQTELGDSEVRVAWVKASAESKLTVAASLAMPTGVYDAKRPANLSFGNYYTLRPEVEYVLRPSAKFALGAKASLGLNTRNRDNDVQSGTWSAVEVAGGYLSPWGLVGLQSVRIQQLGDDEGGSFGASKIRINAAGVFFNTLIPQWGLGVGANTMHTLDSRNAQSGYVSQVRLSKVF